MITKCSYCKRHINVRINKILKQKNTFCSRKCKANYQKTLPAWNKGLIGCLKSHRKGISMIEEYGIEKAEKIRKRQSNIKKGKAQIEQTILKRANTIKCNGSNSGKNNSQYTYGLYYMERKLKREIKQCEICGVDFNLLKSFRYKQIHHKDKNRHNNSRENLLLLCSKCHGRIHSKWNSTKKE